MGISDPRINKGAWTRAEDRKLRQLIENHKGHDWVAAARELGSNRTALQCLTRYQRSHNPSLIAGKWTAEEDELLRQRIAEFGESNWIQVASKMKYRTDQQCLHRWLKSVDPSLVHGKWSKEDDLVCTPYVIIIAMSHLPHDIHPHIGSTV
jgi:myb proto-oncogene protein